MRYLLPLVALLPGCLVHEVRINSDPSATGGVHAVGTAVGTGPVQVQQRGPLPQQLAADWWIPDARQMRSAHALCTTPLPWWQRFPADIATDFWPGALYCTSVAVLAPAPVQTRTEADMISEARAHGYHPAP